MLKIVKIIFWFILLTLLILFCFFFVGKAKIAEKINWGVAFSQKHAELLGLDWKENYLAILDDLRVDHLKLIAYWDSIEKEPGNYNFSDLDWQIQEAEKRKAKVMLVMGRRVPRWPECHFPDWAKSLNEREQQEKVLALIEKIVLRYKDSSAIEYWQVENEPFFFFGECPPPDEDFLREEVSLVKSLDEKNRSVVVTESGEFPLWFKAAHFGDIVGHTLYRKVWISQFKMYFTYPFPPIYYARKAWLINKVFDKQVMCVELQAEPWSPTLMYDSSLEEQEKTMNLERFKKVIQFEKNTGENSSYLWGVEWWYWMKTKHNNPEIWNEAKNLW
jgi:hypothetical protein